MERKYDVYCYLSASKDGFNDRVKCRSGFATARRGQRTTEVAESLLRWQLNGCPGAIVVAEAPKDMELGEALDLWEECMPLSIEDLRHLAPGDVLAVGNLEEYRARAISLSASLRGTDESGSELRKAD